MVSDLPDLQLSGCGTEAIISRKFSFLSKIGQATFTLISRPLIRLIRLVLRQPESFVGQLAS